MKLTIKQVADIRQRRESFQLINVCLNYPVTEGISVVTEYGAVTHLHHNVTLPTGEFCEPTYQITARFLRGLEVICDDEDTRNYAIRALEQAASLLEENHGLKSKDGNLSTHGTIRTRIRNSTYCEYTEQLTRLLKPDVLQTRPQKSFEERPLVKFALTEAGQEQGFAFATDVDITKMSLRVNLDKTKVSDGQTYADQLSQEFAEAIARQNFDLVHVDELTDKAPLEAAIDELGLLIEKYTGYISDVLESHSEIPSDVSDLLNESFSSNLFTIKLI